MQSDFRVEVHRGGAATIVTVGGELDLASSPALEQEIRGELQAGPQLVILDLRALEFMDSTGVSVLIKAHTAAVQAGRRLCLVQGPPQVQRLLALTGVAERFTVVEAPEELLGGG